MNVSLDKPSAHLAQPSREGSMRHRISVETQAGKDEQVCWLEIKQYPYQPDHQVELLHLQAEADALLLQLQAIQQRRQNAQ